MPNPLADELVGARRPQPCVLVIFGASGDLTMRKLVPSLVGLQQDGLLPPGFTVVGFARSERTDAQFREDLIEGVREYGRGDAARTFEEMAGAFRYVRGDYHDIDSFDRLKSLLEVIDEERGTRGNRVFYLATPPATYSPILAQLGRSGLSKMRDDTFARAVVEKPFGHDLGSAKELNKLIGSAFRERQVFRIDHYLGKETVQNILALRFANGIFEPLWNERYVDHVQITVAESIGIGKRGGYFDDAGILRDMIQNHLLQVMTLVAMEPPASIDADAIRDEKVKVLRAIRTPTVDEVATSTVRGQYVRAWHAGAEVNGYREEEGVA
jgi:glucose-6-phosphate 1-dehydrogenase